jgi:hypothetical protein
MNVIEKMNAMDSLILPSAPGASIGFKSKEEISKAENLFELSGVGVADPCRHVHQVFFRNTLSPVPK